MTYDVDVDGCVCVCVWTGWPIGQQDICELMSCWPHPPIRRTPTRAPMYIYLFDFCFSSLDGARALPWTFCEQHYIHSIGKRSTRGKVLFHSGGKSKPSICYPPIHEKLFTFAATKHTPAHRHRQAEEECWLFVILGMLLGQREIDRYRSPSTIYTYYNVYFVKRLEKYRWTLRTRTW